MKIDSTYSDFSAEMEISKAGNVKVLYDEEVILQSLRNIFSTVSGERVRSPIGTTIVRLLFQKMTEATARHLSSSLRTAIQTYEPRVSIISIDVKTDYETRTYNIQIVMSVQKLQKRIVFQNRLRALTF